MTITSISDKQIRERIRIAQKPPACKECLYLQKLGVFKDEDMFYIAQGCQCGPGPRLSTYYAKRSEAGLDLSCFSWKSANDAD